MTSTFTWRPSYAQSGGQTQETSQPRVKKSVFGDGYSQRVPDGINTNPATWNLVFDKIDGTTASAIDAFLSLMAGATSFYWTDLKGNLGFFICEKWVMTYNDEDNVTTQATFTQVFGG